MKYIISALLVALAIVSCAGAQFVGNTIYQDNSASAYASGSGIITQKGANWAVACGDGNYIDQDNVQSASTIGPDINMKAANIALTVGTYNVVTQMNDPSSIDLNQVNELLVQHNESLKSL